MRRLVIRGSELNFPNGLRPAPEWAGRSKKIFLIGNERMTSHEER